MYFKCLSRNVNKSVFFPGLYPIIGWKIGDKDIVYLAEGIASDIGITLTWAQSIGKI